MGTSTPWGPSQMQRELLPGVVFHSTAGHGGIHLSRERQAALSRAVQFETFTGGPWYEEDEDSAVPVAVFAEELPDDVTFGAVRHIRLAAKRDTGNRWADVVRWLDSDAGAAARGAFARHLAANGQLWEVGSMFTLGVDRLWQVSFTRLADGAQQWRVMPYPEKTLYTDAELAALPTEAPATKAG